MVGTPQTPFSVSGAGNRIGAGASGIYRKGDSKLLYDGPALPQALFRTLRATVRTPSSRIKVAFGVGGKITDTNAVSVFYDYGQSCWNAIPYSSQPNSFNSPVALATPNPDTRPMIAGRPIFWMVPPNFTPIGNTPGSSQPDVAAPFIETQGFSAPLGAYGTKSQTAGNTIPPETLMSGYQIGRYLPDAYEATSAAEQYEIYVFMYGQALGNYTQIPIQVWASWEITDPRDGEDTQALLAACTLEAMQTVHT